MDNIQELKIDDKVYFVGQFTFGSMGLRYPKCYIENRIVNEKNKTELSKGLNKHVFLNEKEAFKLKKDVETGKKDLECVSRLWLC